MSHLSLETVARLVDEAPTALEAAHLAACDHCRVELQEMHGQVAQLGALPVIQPPSDDWEQLERRLAAEGLIRPRAPRRVWLHYGVRAAAALALLVSGTLLGRATQATSSVPASPMTSAPAPHTEAPLGLESGPATVAATPADAASALPTPNRLASNAAVTRDPRTPDEALQQLRAAESTYLDLLTRFAELSGSTSTGDPAARLAALQSIVLTTQAALGEAPMDPVINGYYLTARAQRDATLRQIANTNNNSWF